MGCGRCYSKRSEADVTRLLSALGSGNISLSEFLNLKEQREMLKKMKIERVYQGWNAVRHKKFKARVHCEIRSCVHNEISINGCTAPKMVIEDGKCYAFEKSS